MGGLELAKMADWLCRRMWSGELSAGPAYVSGG